MGMGGNGNIRFSKIFPLSWVSHWLWRMSLAKSKGMNFIDYSISLMYWSGLKTGPAKPGRRKNLKNNMQRGEMGIVNGNS